MSGGGGSQNATQVNGINLSSSNYGDPLPIVFGTARVAANLIDWRDFTATAQHAGGGKGGSSPVTGYTYTATVMLAVTEGEITDIPSVWVDKNLYQYSETLGSALSQLGYTLFTGAEGQSPWSYMSSAYPSAALGYSGTAYVAATNYALDDSGGLPNHNFEVSGLAQFGGELNVISATPASGGSGYEVGDLITLANNVAVRVLTLDGSAVATVLMAYSLINEAPSNPVAQAATTGAGTGATFTLTTGGVIDANPAAIIPILLTNVRFGAAFPSSSIGDLTQYATYCQAAGLFVSPVFDQSTQAQQEIDTLTQVTNSAVVWSEGKLKIIPYGDTPITANGTTFTPNVTPLYALDADDFLDRGKDQALVGLTRKSPADVYNSFKLECVDRSNGYNAVPVVTQDQASIDQYGLRQASDVTYHGFTQTPIAQFALELMKQRVLYVINNYEFRLGWNYAMLEPMDIVTITEPGLGLNNWPVRIIDWQEDDDGQITIQAEDFPAGVGHAPMYPSAGGAGSVRMYNADPGNIADPIFIEPPTRFAGETGLAVWIAITGESALWGGCNIYVSHDGDTYALFGTCTGGARYGALNADMPATGDPADVTLTGLGGDLPDATTANAQLLTTLCAVDNEFFAYASSAMTGDNEFALTGLVRGAYGSSVVAHSSGAPFVRLDTSIVKSDALDLLYIGETLYFKFQSFNIYGGGMQDLADLEEFTYTLNGNQVLTVGQPPVTLTGLGTVAGVLLTWTTPPANPGNTEIWSTLVERAPQVDDEVGTFVQIGTSTSHTYTDSVLDGNTYYYRVRCQDQYGNITGYSNELEIVASIGSGGSGGGGLPVSVSPASLLKLHTGAGTGITGIATATATGGTPPYTYAWAYTSGATGISISAPTANQTTFYETFTNEDVSGNTAIFTCTVTDSASNTGSATISVTLNNVGTD